LSSQAVARRYATALADVVLNRGEAREIQEELKGWEKMIASSALLQELLLNPTIPYDQKQKALNQLIARTKVRERTANFLRVLLRNQRLSELATINEKITQVFDERAGLVSAEVTSARPVPDNTKAELNKKLRELTGSEVRINFTTDENLIGGIVTRIGSTVYDGSVRNQLDELGKRLTGN
jgi:F-type H+-transporting ATPase subunit delta